MTLKYTLSEADFLEFQLYAAAKSERIQKKRWKSRVIMPILYLLMGVYFFFFSDVLFAEFGCLLVAILWYFLYPIYERRRYRNHYQNHIRENYQNRIGRFSTIDFQKDFLFSKSGKNEGKISTEELEELIELKNHFLLKLKTSETLIFPKSILSNADDFRKFIFENYEIPFTNDLEWIWK